MKKVVFILAALVAFAELADARKVTGSVMCGEELLEGVIVTDGANFTKTNFKGKFTLDIKDDAEHVYIVTPAGYVADWSSGVPEFYQVADGKKKFEFNLQKLPAGVGYNIVAMADPQTYSTEHFAKFAGKPMEDLCETIGSLKGTTVGLALGDISWDDLNRLDDYKKEIVRAGVPFYPVSGNHDNSAWCNGDHEAMANYRIKMGPENYAFFLGKDVVIVLDNIIYETNFKYVEGYADHVLNWVRSLMEHIPSDSEIYIAQHASTGNGRRRIAQANRLFDIVRGRKVTILSGHTHVNSNFTWEKNITEHNIAAICGAWWDTELCTDGTPKGYKVFTKIGDRLTWYYKPVNYSSSHIAEAFGLGEAKLHPNSVVVNVWDWDPEWKVEWYEDGVHMGAMDPVMEVPTAYQKEIAEVYFRMHGEQIPEWKSGRPSRHHFAATPSRYAKRVLISVESRFGQKWNKVIDLTGFVEEHAYVGDVAAIESAVQKGANSLMMDLAVDMSGQVKVGGENGKLMSEVIDSTDAYITAKRRSPIRYNFELHTVTGKEEGRSVPYYHDYADHVMDSLWVRFMGDRLQLTSSDYRALNHLNVKYPEVDLAFKVEKDVDDIDKAMARLKFVPKWISVHYSILDASLLKKYHDKGMYVSVWGIPDDETKKRIKELGPDALIYQ